VHIQPEQGNELLINQRAPLNHYAVAARLLYRRMLWDVRPQSWVSRARIKTWKGTGQGKKAVILCNGPSLLKSDLSLLDGVFTFGLNKINLLFDRSEFRPSSIVAVNPHVIEQNRDFFNDTDIPLFLDAVATKQVRARSNVIYIPGSSERVFAKDCSMSLYASGTVTFVALQLAFYMGFEQVALIGADHSFATSGPSNQLVDAEEKDESHFDPRYFSGNMKWRLPDLFESEVGYVMAQRMYSAYGRNLVNCTEGGELEVLRRMGLADFVGSE